MATDLQSAPGFQGSETTSCEVMLYGSGDDPIILGADDSAMPFTGRYRTDPDPSLISVQTAKAMGGGAGTFTLQCKPPRGITETMFERIVDDDWIDIVFKRHGRVWHTMRGTLDNIRRRRSTSGSGATTHTYNLSGRDFQKQFEITPLWFNRVSHENIEGALAQKVYSILSTIGGDPAETAQAFLIGWLQELESLGRANWPMPTTMPNTLGTFISDIQRGFDLSMFSNQPPRNSISPNLSEPQGTVWSLAQEWSDPGFCELFCDLGRRGVQLEAGEELPVDDSTMSVFFRDRPFPLTYSPVMISDNGLPGLPTEKDSWWFQLPLHTVPRQQISEDELGRGGEERINAFYVSPQIMQEFMATGMMDIVQPLWDSADIYRHGLRRYDVATRYMAKDAQLATMTKAQRYIARDWYMMNPYLLNGTLSLRVGRPDIRIGTRVRIPGESGESTLDETYYVESVSHQWQFGAPMQTSLGVTRGWIGTDDDLLRAMDILGARYQVPRPTQPQEIVEESAP